MKVKVDMKPINQILKDKGLDPRGDVQRHVTNTIMLHMKKYMPKRTNATINAMIAQTDINKPEIIVDQPYAKFLYYGKLMVDPVTGAAGFLDKNGEWKSWKKRPKVKSDRPITYTTTKNPLAGPYWDRRMMQAEGAQIAKEIQEYVDRKAGKK